MPPSSSDDRSSARRSAIEEEQEFLDLATARRDRLIQGLSAELAVAAGDAVAHSRQRELRRQHDQLARAQDRLVFGRLDSLDGTVRHIGRVGLRCDETGAAAEPLLVDWRAPAARPFYTATSVDPQGQTRRRQIRTRGSVVLGVDDEPLDGTAAAGLVGEGALLAALDERRTTRMSTAAATLQREQDAIVRAPAAGPLIVQGGPGTGKTVVALHRVAYLLFTHRQLAEQAVLVLGPSPRFLEYIAEVLPALGETAVVAATCDTLVPGAAVQRAETREVSELKGRALWQAVLERQVAGSLPPARDLRLKWDGEFHVIDAATVAEILASVTPGRPYHRAREAFAEQLHQVLAEAVAERRMAMLDEVEEGLEELLADFDRRAKIAPVEVDRRPGEEEIEELREGIAASPAVARFVESWWPGLEPGDQLRRLLRDPSRLRRLAPELTAEEVALVAAEPAPWAASDLPLLDAVAELLGDQQAPAAQGEFLADRARGQRDWVYGHVVIDEAQELSEMQWQMVLRRCPARSITAVGDIDQAEASHRHTTWAEAVGAALGERWTAAELTVCYRTPREVMELTGPVLAKAGSRNAPPRAVRSSGIEPWRQTVEPAELPAAAARAVEALRLRWAGGTVGVIAPAGRIAELQAALSQGPGLSQEPALSRDPGLSDLPVLTATEAKGLEWDATLLVDPDGIAAEPRGWNGLYVALTRCTQELGRLEPAPA